MKRFLAGLLFLSLLMTALLSVGCAETPEEQITETTAAQVAATEPEEVVTEAPGDDDQICVHNHSLLIYTILIIQHLRGNINRKETGK